MSNRLAIAAVTAALHNLVQEGADTLVGEAVNMSLSRPNVPAADTTPDPTIHIFLYRIAPNAALRNNDLPSYDSGGHMTQRPTVAIDLYYLLTFLGDDSKFEPQKLLGHTARKLHSLPVLDSAKIHEATSVTFVGDLADSDLHKQIEQVKFTPVAMSLEELSKLWSVFFQTPYALSVVYKASVVLIEADGAPKETLPVAGRAVRAVPIGWPAIETVRSEGGAGVPITSAEPLVLEGKNLSSDRTEVQFDGGAWLRVAALNTEITVPWPADIRAGLHSIRVRHKVAMGDPPRDIDMMSNLSGFVLQPLFDQVALNPGDAEVSGIRPKVVKTQIVRLHLHQVDVAVGQETHTYLLPAPADNGIVDPDTETDSITFDISGIEAGKYLVTIQVDDSESPLTIKEGSEFPGETIDVP